jgi:hypothetical protein
MWSGQDSELHNKVIELTCTMLKVKQMFTSSRSSNSLARQERVHRTCNEMLRILVNKATKDWGSYLPLVEFRIRNLPNAVTGYTPFQLRHGRHPRFAGVDCDAADSLDLQRFPKAKEYLTELEHSFTDMSDIVGMLVSEAEAASSASLNAKRKDTKFKEGEYVVLHAPIRTKGAASRLTKNWIGPFIVTMRPTATKATRSSTSTLNPSLAMEYTTCVHRQPKSTRENMPNGLQRCGANRPQLLWLDTA